MPMVEVAYEILKTTTPEETTYAFRDLMQAVVEVKQLELTQEQLVKLSSHLYTDLNIDGRFASTQNRTWGLKSWKTITTDTYLDIDDSIDEEEDVEITELGEDLGIPKLTNKDYEEPRFSAGDDGFGQEEDLDNKTADDELEPIPPLSGEEALSIEDLKIKEDEPSDDDSDDDE